MNAKRKLAAVIGAGVAPLLAVCLPANTASAHGWVTSPPSRQDQCANGVVDCGAIQWEPQSVEGPKGLRSCSGGNGRFSELNDDSKGWRVTGVGSSTTFTWQITANHSTSTWQYFVAGQKVAEFNDHGRQPPDVVRHQVNFGGISGRQTVLAVWNIADTANAFYACVDVNIGGGDGGGPGEPDPPGPCTAPGWEAGTVYNGNDTVTWEGHTWRAKWWVKGTEPGTTGEWGVWQDLGACA